MPTVDVLELPSRNEPEREIEVVIRNVDDFLGIDVEVINPWD